MAPIQFPEVTLSGVTYILKYSLASIIFADKHGVSSVPPGEGASVAAQSEFIANHLAVTAHVMKDGRLVHANLTPLEMASMIETRDMQAIADKIGEASGKVSLTETSQLRPAA